MGGGREEVGDEIGEEVGRWRGIWVVVEGLLLLEIKVITNSFSYAAKT